jgi:hypothetical protein
VPGTIEWWCGTPPVATVVVWVGAQARHLGVSALLDLADHRLVKGGRALSGTTGEILRGGGGEP